MLELPMLLYPPANAIIGGLMTDRLVARPVDNLPPVVYIKVVEEQEMVARFGDEYLAYRRRVPFIIPRPRGRRGKERSGLSKGWCGMKTTTLPDRPDAKSPAGADIRFLMDGETGNMIHSTVPPRQVNRATIHATVNEFWYVLEGRGEIWRDNGVESCVTVLVPGVSIDIPAGTAFQYRNLSDRELKFICVTMPPWPGDSEASYVEGIWQPTV